MYSVTRSVADVLDLSSKTQITSPHQSDHQPLSSSSLPRPVTPYSHVMTSVTPVSCVVTSSNTAGQKLQRVMSQTMQSCITAGSTRDKLSQGLIETIHFSTPDTEIKSEINRHIKSDTPPVLLSEDNQPPGLFGYHPLLKLFTQLQSAASVKDAPASFFPFSRRAATPLGDSPREIPALTEQQLHNGSFLTTATMAATTQPLHNRYLSSISSMRRVDLQQHVKTQQPQQRRRTLRDVRRRTSASSNGIIQSQSSNGVIQTQSSVGDSSSRGMTAAISVTDQLHSSSSCQSLDNGREEWGRTEHSCGEPSLYNHSRSDRNSLEHSSRDDLILEDHYRGNDHRNDHSVKGGSRENRRREDRSREDHNREDRSNEDRGQKARSQEDRCREDRSRSSSRASSSADPTTVDKKSDYLERRKKNNEAAKRSRDSRRLKEEETAMRAAYLEHENLRLKAELEIWRTESAKLHRLIYNRL